MNQVVGRVIVVVARIEYAGDALQLHLSALPKALQQRLLP